VARFFCFILVLVVVALASALWVQAGGNNPLIDLLAYAEARAQSVSLDNPTADQARAGWSAAPAYAGGARDQGSGTMGQQSEIEVAGTDAERKPPPTTESVPNPFPAPAHSYPDTSTALPIGGLPPANLAPPIPDAQQSAIHNPQSAINPQPLTLNPQPNAPPANLTSPLPNAQQSAIRNPKSAVDPQPSTFNPQAIAPPQPFERTKVIARVGSEVILLGDVLPTVETMLADAVKAGRIPEEQLPAFREYLTRMQVKELVARKLIYLDAKRTIPAANFPKVEEQMAEAWDKDVLNAMVRRMAVDNPAQLDAKLREAGSTLEREKRNFVEQTLASQWLRTKIDEDQEISHEMMLEYYQQHLAEYQVSARARWEHLMVRVDKSHSEAEAYARIAQMGNRLWGGVPWAEVARRESEGPTAAQGGLRDWTTRGSLISTVIDRALFDLPLGALSPILKDDQGFHIVRVVERTEAGQTPFSELQATIRDKIRSERLKQQRTEFVDKLKRGVTIWTIFDGEAAAEMVSLEPRPGRKQ